jgi:alanine dehydrogenase
MRIGVPTERTTDEDRVGMRPAGVEVLTARGHEVAVESGAGLGSGLTDDEYAAAGATIVSTADELWDRAELVVKVKDPQPEEFERMREGQVVFGSFHFAADRALTEAALRSRITAIAYETLTAPGPNGGTVRPLLTPSSEIAGRLAAQQGAKYLERASGGRGVLLGGVPGVEPGNVLVIGAGVVGQHAATIAFGMGAHIVLMDTDNQQMRRLGEVMPRQLITVFADPEAIRHYLSWADVVIGAVLVPGAKTPTVITRDHLALMKPGSVIVDVAIDQGGCCETSRMTTHSDPVFEVDGVLHYCVGNMPGAVARTSTWALTNATLPWVVRIADEGVWRLRRGDQGFRDGVNMHRGELLNRGVADAHGLELAEA